MTQIPYRPDAKAAPTMQAHFILKVEHEHAVAKVAVEALRAMLETEIGHEIGYAEHVVRGQAREALRQIKESGWRDE